MTILAQSLQLVKAGNMEAALALAKTDEGFNQDATLEQFAAFAAKANARRDAEDAAAKDYYNSPMYA